MPLPDDFPEKKLLEENDYNSVEEVSEAPDEELLAIEGIAEIKLKRIRERAPYVESKDETGTGQTSEAATTSSMVPGPNTDTDSHFTQDRSSKPSLPGGQPSTFLEEEQIRGEAPKDPRVIDPLTRQELPKGIHVNERGTLTASTAAHESQSEIISPEQSDKDQRSKLEGLRRNLQRVFS